MDECGALRLAVDQCELLCISLREYLRPRPRGRAESAGGIHARMIGIPNTTELFAAESSLAENRLVGRSHFVNSVTLTSGKCLVNAGVHEAR